MSFPHIDFFTPNRSTLIKEDLLVSFVEVDSMAETIIASENSTPNWKEIDTIPDRLNRVSDVYNQNIEFVTEKLKSFNSNIPTDQSQDPVTQRAQMISCEEHAQYAQIARVCDVLKKKIETLNDRIYRFLRLYPSTKTQFAITSLWNAPNEYSIPLQMREVNRPAQLEAPATTKQVLMMAAKGNEINSRPVQVTVKSDVGEGNTLGICFHPDWGNKPTAFARTFQGYWSGWIGKVPTNVEFKFVIIKKDGQIQWEQQSQNRKLPQNNPALFLTSDQVQF